jgi:hypothetical protein
MDNRQRSVYPQQVGGGQKESPEIGIEWKGDAEQATISGAVPEQSRRGGRGKGVRM